MWNFYPLPISSKHFGEVGSRNLSGKFQEQNNQKSPCNILGTFTLDALSLLPFPMKLNLSWKMEASSYTHAGMKHVVPLSPETRMRTVRAHPHAQERKCTCTNVNHL